MGGVVEEVEARVAGLSAPIPGAKPAGEDLSFDTEFERVKAELEKIGKVANIPPNWAMVASSSTKLLGRTKDMRVASWYATGRAREAGWVGLVEGLVVLRALIKGFWDTMYPERRPRARANIFAWMTEQVVACLGGPENGTQTGRPEDREAILACEALFRDIDVELSEKLGDVYPGVGTIRSLITGALIATPAAQPSAPSPEPSAVAAAPQVAPVAQPVPQAAAAAPAAAPVPTPARAENVEQVGEVLTSSRETLLAAAALLRGRRATDAQAYAVQRAAIWLSVQAGPPSEGGKTFIPGPPAKLRKELEGHAAASRWTALLDAAEPLTGAYLYWLDLHQYVGTALQNLGAEGEEAGRVVRSAATALVDRFAELLTLNFRDGTPFATAETQAWLRQGQGGGPSNVQAVLGQQDEEAAKMLATARKEVADGRVGDGVGLLLELARRAPSGRARFDLEFEAARVALDARKSALARPILDGLIEEIEAHGLREWEPSRCAPVYAALLSALRSSAVGGVTVDADGQQAAILGTLCRLDPALAVQLGV